jgi:hypothetical protein
MQYSTDIKAYTDTMPFAGIGRTIEEEEEERRRGVEPRRRAADCHHRGGDHGLVGRNGKARHGLSAIAS